MLLTGILDKSQIGSSSFGLFHGFFEIYGYKKTAYLISAVTKLCIDFLKMRGFSCGLEDLALNEQGNKERSEILN